MEGGLFTSITPTGMFDVRYSNRKKTKKLDKEMQRIEMRRITYPVKVRAEKTGISITYETRKTVNERLKSGEEITISNSAISKPMLFEDIIPNRYAFEQNYPIPFNPSKKIEFSIPEEVNYITLILCNGISLRVAELANSLIEDGQNIYLWNVM